MTITREDIVDRIAELNILHTDENKLRVWEIMEYRRRTDLVINQEKNLGALMQTMNEMDSLTQKVET